jgi:hypothetical protein
MQRSAELTLKLAIKATRAGDGGSARTLAHFQRDVLGDNPRQYFSSTTISTDQARHSTPWPAAYASLAMTICV